MPLTVTALSGQHEDDVQIPVTFLRLEIPDHDTRIHDLDVPLSLHPSTLAASLYTISGGLVFSPGPGFVSPDLSHADNDPTTELRISIAKQDNSDWYAILAAGDYRDAPVSLWQGNLTLAAGSPPWAATVTGVVLEWRGEITHLEVSDDMVSIIAEPPDFFRAVIPRQVYTYKDFPSMPKPGAKFHGGSTLWYQLRGSLITGGSPTPAGDSTRPPAVPSPPQGIWRATFVLRPRTSTGSDGGHSPKPKPGRSSRQDSHPAHRRPSTGSSGDRPPRRISSLGPEPARAI